MRVEALLERAARQSPSKTAVVTGAGRFTYGEVDERASDLARALSWSNGHPDEMARMGANAQRRYEACYTPEVNYGQLMGVYERAISRGRSGGRASALPDGGNGLPGGEETEGPDRQPRRVTDGDQDDREGRDENAPAEG